MHKGYSEPELVSNRAAVLLCGGSAAERKAWVDEAARSLEQPPFLLENPADLPALLERPDGVVLIPDVTALRFEDQGLIVRCIREREERPKLVVALAGSLQAAQERGHFRDDLQFALALGQIDLSDGRVKETIEKRRARWTREKAAAPLRRSPSKKR